MSDSDNLQADFDKLNDLIVNCPDFDRLEALLGGFNLFQVLKFEHGEIRHSNVLAWILDPDESHGLDSTFLKKWLMRVLHESSGETNSSITPVDIDAWQLTDVEVRREWQNIDVLLILNLLGGGQWVVCIENKIKSAQHSNQLRRYRSIVESQFPDATRRLFLFLTKSNEIPEDGNYIAASYTQVHQALKESLQNRSHAIGSEPKVLLDNYLRLLEEKFMEESDIAKTALRIYQQHRRALDIIFENRPDNIRTASDKVCELLSAAAGKLGIIMGSSNKRYIRFYPREWDLPGNKHGKAWTGMKQTVIFEMSFNGRHPYLYVIVGKAPDAWIAPLWELAGSPPFKRPKKVRPRIWCSLHMFSGAKVSLEDEDFEDSEEIAKMLFDWACASFQSPESKEIIKIISGRLPDLDQIYMVSQP